MRNLAALSFLLLAGCAGVASYRPYVQDIIDPAALARDEADCLKYAEAYSAPLDIATIARQAAQGGANNMAGAAVNPLVPVLGAAGGATSATLAGLGILNDSQRRVFLKCLEHRGERSRAYDVMDPNIE